MTEKSKRYGMLESGKSLPPLPACKQGAHHFVFERSCNHWHCEHCDERRDPYGVAVGTFNSIITRGDVP